MGVTGIGEDIVGHPGVIGAHDRHRSGGEHEVDQRLIAVPCLELRFASRGPRGLGHDTDPDRVRVDLTLQEVAVAAQRDGWRPIPRRPIGELHELGTLTECIAEQDRRFGEDGERLTLEVPVEMTEPTGAETIVVIRLGGQRVLARVSPDVKLQPGGSGCFALDMRRACLFDPRTGALIA